VDQWNPRDVPYYRSIGDVPPKRHTQHRTSDGALLREELVGEEGFSSDSALLYHREIPSAITASREWSLPAAELQPNHPLRPRHLRLPALAVGGDVVTGRQTVLGNADVRLGWVVTGADSPLHRNVVGDEVVFVKSGSGELQTVLGALAFSAGDLVVVPKGLTHRWTHREPCELFIVSATGHVHPPHRYLSARGQHLEHAIFCERDLRGPTQPLLLEGAQVDVFVRHLAGGREVGSILTHATHPFDVVGWDGCLYPWALSVNDVEPITGRVHQPPPVHQVLEGPGFVVCAFVPRKVDYHPLSVPVPYWHANTDSDEVLLYVAGDYAARGGSGIASGSVSLHPAGHTHGPQPGAVERSLGKDFFDELAVMVDTFRPLELGPAAQACDDPAYAWSWTER
jgi:homogentisate 1,2-dioxygenase